MTKRRRPNVVEIPAGPRQSDPLRRTRIAARTDPQVRGWLQRMARTHAHIATTVRLFGCPQRAGGQSLHGETYAERAARGDRTLLADAVLFCMDELAEIHREIVAIMDAAPATAALPGTPDKVAEMERRANGGFSLFIAGDARTPED